MANKGKLLLTLLVMGSVALAACGPFFGGPVEKTIYVAPYRADCVGVAPQKCLLVKEKPEEDWTFYYDTIGGFEYEEGYEYELRIVEEKIDNPPADASSIRWTLVEVVNKTLSPLGTTWVMDSYLNGEGVLVNAQPGSTATVRFREGQVDGNASCNSYFGTYEVDGDKVQIQVGGVTEMYCFPEELMAQEGDFLAALAEADTYQMAEGKLQLADAAGNPVLTFSALVPVPLVGTIWLFTGYSDGQGSAVSALADTQVTALFGEDGTVSGSAGCNSYTGSYQVEDMGASSGAISFGPVASTMMMCPEPIMAQEMAYLSALESAAGYQIEGSTLTVTDAEGTMLLTFVVREPMSLLGTTWQMTFYNNGKGGFTSAVLGTEVTATFGEDGRVTGSAGCNNYSASFELDGDAISIGPAMTTRMMCAEPEGIMDQETAYLAALESSATYKIEGDSLELWSADGSRMASYVVMAGEAGLSQDALANMEYSSEWTQSGVAPLVNGEYREQAAPGSATETIVQLTEHVAYGELAGQPAAAVVLVTDPGGSGTFYDLAVVVEEGGQPVHVASTLLGDRVQIVSMDIVGYEIVVEMIAHGPDDPMCCPTQQVVRTFALEGGQLVQTSG